MQLVRIQPLSKRGETYYRWLEKSIINAFEIHRLGGRLLLTLASAAAPFPVVALVRFPRSQFLPGCPSD